LTEALISVLWRVGHWAYALIFLGAALESAAFLGFVVPGETLVIVSGVLASLGLLELPELLVAVTAGAIVGDQVSYRLGRRLGRGWLLRHGGRVGLDESRLGRVEQFYERYGGPAVVFGRFVGFLRPLVPFVAGAARMTYPRFLCFNVAACVLWAVVTVLLGYLLGESWELVERWIGRTGFMAAAVVVVIASFLYLRRRRLVR
jgi:membrane protein DedA with SNARE-associated domain